MVPLSETPAPPAKGRALQLASSPTAFHSSGVVQPLSLTGVVPSTETRLSAAGPLPETAAS
jgi:hypothetical protein